MLGGLRFNGLGFWQTGAPLTVTSSVDQASGLATINLPTVTTDRPNVAAHVVTNGTLTQFFNVSAFAQQPLGTAGNEGRNQYYGPHLRRGDLSLFKTIPVHERAQLELRAECINITNTPNFDRPNHTITQIQYRRTHSSPNCSRRFRRNEYWRFWHNFEHACWLFRAAVPVCRTFQLLSGQSCDQVSEYVAMITGGCIQSQTSR